MTKQARGLEPADHWLKGNVMLGKKENLRQYENMTVSLMVEYRLDQSDHDKESAKLMDSIDRIIQMAKKRWA